MRPKLSRKPPAAPQAPSHVVAASGQVSGLFGLRGFLEVAEARKVRECDLAWEKHNAGD